MPSSLSRWVIHLHSLTPVRAITSRQYMIRTPIIHVRRRQTPQRTRVGAPLQKPLTPPLIIIRERCTPLELYQVLTCHTPHCRHRLCASLSAQRQDLLGELPVAMDGVVRQRRASGVDTPAGLRPVEQRVGPHANGVRVVLDETDGALEVVDEQRVVHVHELDLFGLFQQLVLW